MLKRPKGSPKFFTTEPEVTEMMHNFVDGIGIALAFYASPSAGETRSAWE